PLRRERRRNYVYVFHADGLMYAVRTDIANPQVEILSHLSLGRQVPLHDVIAMRVRLKICLPKRVRRCGDDIERLSWKGAGRQIRSASKLIKGCGKELSELDEVRQGQHVKNSEAPTQHGLSIAEWIPRKS